MELLKSQSMDASEKNKQLKSSSKNNPEEEEEVDIIALLKTLDTDIASVFRVLFPDMPLDGKETMDILQVSNEYNDRF